MYAATNANTNNAKELRAYFDTETAEYHVTEWRGTTPDEYPPQRVHSANAVRYMAAERGAVAVFTNGTGPDNRPPKRKRFVAEADAPSNGLATLLDRYIAGEHHAVREVHAAHPGKYGVTETALINVGGERLLGRVAFALALMAGA